MLLLLEIGDIGWLVLIVDTSFSTIPVDVCELVDGECVLLVDSHAVELLGCCDSLLWRVILDEGVAVFISMEDSA